MSLSRRTLLAASSLLAIPGFTARLLGQETKDQPAKEPQDDKGPKKSNKDDAWNSPRRATGRSSEAKSS